MIIRLRKFLQDTVCSPTSACFHLFGAVDISQGVLLGGFSRVHWCVGEYSATSLRGFFWEGSAESIGVSENTVRHLSGGSSGRVQQSPLVCRRIQCDISQGVLLGGFSRVHWCVGEYSATSLRGFFWEGSAESIGVLTLLNVIQTPASLLY